MGFQEADAAFVEREKYGKRGSHAGFTMHIHASSVILDDALDDHQADAGAIYLGGVVRFKNMAYVLGGDA